MTKNLISWRKMKDIVRLFRLKHYIKNILVFVPLVFMGSGMSMRKIMHSAAGFLAFCLISSCIYIINAARDIEEDRLHPTKRNRPMASGAVSLRSGILCAIVCFAAAIGSMIYLVFFCGGDVLALGWLLLYFVLNLAYSFWFKNIPIIDIIILMSGFLIRILFGAVIAGTFVSSWLYLTVMSGAFYFALGKRRNEITNTEDVGSTRKVLKVYSHSFLDKFMYVSLAMANIFYALWAKEYPKKYMILTVPLVVIICMQYSLDVEGNSDGDPVEVVLRDRKLMIFCLFLIVAMSAILFAL